ncbi:MAG TPA: endolytic transglycosylase MltG, partial [Chitinophagaceae bacterium]|nr:endolytic transglycosylase MltG [Chitinophagaceae bacterium]
NSDSLEKFGRNEALAMSVVLPDTYTFFWDTKPGTVYKKLADESEKFWTSERIEKAKSLQLTPAEAYTLASIVDEESNAMAEKGNIASVYLNRVHKGMPLQADPTIRFALNDFTIKRIYGDHLNVASPYNTYRNKGLPPGPICTPSKKTIDAVLNAPSTDYIYFVADSSFNGRHLFSATYEEHLQKARWYQEAFRRRFSPGK